MQSGGEGGLKERPDPHRMVFGPQSTGTAHREWYRAGRAGQQLQQFQGLRRGSLCLKDICCSHTRGDRYLWGAADRAVLHHHPPLLCLTDSWVGYIQARFGGVGQLRSLNREVKGDAHKQMKTDCMGTCARKKTQSTNQAFPSASKKLQRWL